MRSLSYLVDLQSKKNRFLSCWIGYTLDTALKACNRNILQKSLSNQGKPSLTAPINYRFFQTSDAINSSTLAKGLLLGSSGASEADTL
jgi:hypothetical protein